MMNKNGFSVIELMTIVAIIGILAAIAVPNWTSYQNKAKQNEAKANLEALYAAEKTFFFDSVFYNPRLDGVGYSPVGALAYRVGFAVDTGAPGAPGTAGCINTSPAAQAICNASGIIPGYLGTWTENPFYAAPLAVGANTPGTFTGEARANISGNGPDVWTINESKVLLNTTPSIY